MRWRKARDEVDRPVDDRAWSARTSVRASNASTEMVRYGVDAHYHGPTGARRAQHQQGRLADVSLAASIRPHESGGATLWLGPLQHDAAWLALEAFLGRPIDATI